jgi:LacI family transcriptional regulator
VSKNITSHDVARLAGVSQPTVSRALRNLPGTSPETRERVRAAAQQLAYVPISSGRALSTRKTRRIAVVAEELTNPFYPQLVEPIRQHLAGHDYLLVLLNGAVTVDALADGSYDGVMLCTTGRHASLPRDLTERDVPHVLVNRTLDVPESSSCSYDNVAGARSLGDFVARLGHERIGAIQGPTEFSTSRERATGLRAALRAHGLHLRREDVRRVAYTYADGRAAALDLLGGGRDADDRPTALVCGNDVVAIGALAAARTLGLRVPDELTVVGFDDIAMASWDLINLTTMRCDLEVMARTAIELLLAAMDGEAARQVRLPAQLVPRATHAARILAR